MSLNIGDQSFQRDVCIQSNPVRFGRTRLVVMTMLLMVYLLDVGCSQTNPIPISKKPTEELLDLLANSKDDQLRADVVRLLAVREPQTAISMLSVMLRDQSEMVRMACVSALGESTDPKATDVLWAAAQDPVQGRRVRLGAARALADRGDARAAEPLVQALGTSRDEATAGLLALGKSAVPALIAALRVSETRQIATTALMYIGTPAVDPLLDVLRTDSDKYARYAAAGILAEMTDARVDIALAEALKQSDQGLDAASYRFLIRRGLAGSEPRLINLLNVFGTRTMAEDFISSGNPLLKSAAEAWARGRKQSITGRLSDLPEAHWAGVDPSIRQVALFHLDGSLASTEGLNPLQSSGTSFVPGKWGSAVSVAKGGMLKYPTKLLNFKDGTIEMWIAPVLDGDDPVYKKYNHALLLYPSPKGDQFLVSEGNFAGFYAGTVIGGKFAGAGGGSLTSWKKGTWHHIAFTYSSRALRQRLYLDGTLTVETRAPMPAPDAGQDAFTFGCDPYSNWTAFSIDELAIADGEKSPDVVRTGALRSEPSR